MIKTSLFALFLACIFTNVALAEIRCSQGRIVCTNGNIVLINKVEKVKTLTQTGLDLDDMSLSPDERALAFVRRTPNKMIESGLCIPDEANEIWIMDIDGKNARKIVEAKASENMEDVLTCLSSPVFSNDGSKVFFRSAAWSTSGAIHCVDLHTMKTRFIMPGSTVAVVAEGKYKGYLVSCQHRYWESMGSYDWYWLLTQEGKDVAPLCDESGDWNESGQPIEALLGDNLADFIQFAIKADHRDDVKQLITDLNPAFSNNAVNLIKEAEAKISISNSISIGTVSISISNNIITIKNPVTTLQYEYSLDNHMEYYFILPDPFSAFANDDGVILNGVIEPTKTRKSLLSRNLKYLTFPKFAFFSDKLTTIGFLFGMAGASGGSGQEMILMDTESDKHVVINISDAQAPYWIAKDQYPPVFAETDVKYLGDHCTGMGYAPRIGKVFTFQKGKYVHDRVLEKAMCLRKFEAIHFTKGELSALKTTNLCELDRDLGKKLLDYIHYGRKSGHVKNVSHLLKECHPSSADDALSMIKHGEDADALDLGKINCPEISGANKASNQVFQLFHPIEFANTTAFGPITKSEAERLMKEKLIIGSSSDDAYEFMSTNSGSMDTNIVFIRTETCEQYLAAVKQKAYAYTTFDITMQGWFDRAAGALTFIKSAYPAQQNLLPENLLTELSVELLGWSGYDRNHTLNDYALAGMVKILKTKRHEINFKTRSKDFWIQEMVRGDYDHDGFDDALVNVAWNYIAGSGSGYDNYLVSRTDPKAKSCSVKAFRLD